MATGAQCDACGETNAPDAAFCLFCGAYLGWDQQAPGAAPTPASGPAPAPASTATPAPPATPPPGNPPRQSGAPRQPGPAQQSPTQPIHRPAPAPGPAPAPAPTPSPAASAAPPGGCPACGHVNEPGRRFCGRCGHLLVTATPPTTAPSPRPVPTGRGWWIFGDPADRAARREYRRSLPPLYRWRRVIVTLLVLAAGAGLLAALTGDPVGWVRQRWYDVRGETEPLTGVTAAAVPEGSVLKGYSLAGVTDKDPRTAWATSWPDETVVSSECGGTSGVAGIELTWAEPVRLRGLEVRAGLSDDESARDLQYHPTRLDIQLPDGRCVAGTLEDTSGWQEVELDSETEVRSVVLSVGDVTPASGEAQQDAVALSGVRLLVRPE